MLGQKAKALVCLGRFDLQVGGELPWVGAMRLLAAESRAVVIAVVVVVACFQYFCVEFPSSFPILSRVMEACWGAGD